MSSRLFFIDTDAGTDDAVALMMAMSTNIGRIVAISTVGGNVPLENVNQNVLYLREICEYDCSVFQGCSTPLVRTPDQASFIHGSDGMGDIGLPLSGRQTDSGNAALKMIETSHLYNGKLELVALGPLTNLALAIKIDPDLVHRIKKCHIMGGLYTPPGNITPVSEYNIWADPEAAKIVVRSGMDIQMTGWDTTLQGGFLTTDELNELKKISPLGSLASRIQNVKLKWLKDQNLPIKCYLADALAMSIVLDQEIALESKVANIDVLLSDDHLPSRGQICFNEDNNFDTSTNIDMVTRCDRDQFAQMIFKLLK